MRITVVYSPAPRVTREWALDLSEGATAREAVRRIGLLDEFPDAPLEAGAVAVWGRRVDAAQILRDGDRVEVCRPLRVDPKVARRERFDRQGARAAGLFARRK